MGKASQMWNEKKLMREWVNNLQHLMMEKQELFIEVRCVIVRNFEDENGCIHGLAKFPVVIGATSGKKRGLVKQCDVCKKLTTCFCACCMKPLCYSFTNKHSRTCFVDHIPNRTSVRISNA